MRVTAFIIFLTLFQISAASSESRIPVYGIIIDKNTVQGVEEAAVSICSSDTDSYAMSDSTGCFVLYAPEGAECRICVSKKDYRTVISDVFMVTSCTPFIRIEMNRDITDDGGTINISNLIELADLTYHEKTYDSTFFNNDIARIQNEENIRKLAKGQVSSILKVIRKEKPSGKTSKHMIHNMMLPESLSMFKKQESLIKISGRRNKEGRRIKAFLRAGHNIA